MATTTASVSYPPTGALLTTTPDTNSKPAPHWKQPSHPTLIAVETGERSFSDHGVSLVDLPAGAVFAPMSAATTAHRRTYATVQAGVDRDIELNSDLVFCNHSCDPSLVFDMGKMEVRVGERALKKGDDLTFFYPSTEFDMAQPFQCTCGSDKCVGTIRGARWLSKDVLARYWLNDHIVQLLGEGSAVGGKVVNGEAKVNGH